MEDKRKGIKIASIVILCINILLLFCFAYLVIFLRRFYYEDAKSIALFERMLNGRSDANAIRFFLSAHYLFIFIAAILIVKEWLQRKNIIFIINIILLIMLVFATPVVLAWFEHLVPIFKY